MAAMIEAISRQSYPDVTIAELVALAGVSKSAFYRCFDSKEACFLATFEEIVERGAEQIEAAYRSGQGYRDGMTRAFEKFAAVALEQTAAARLVFVDSLSLGASAVAARDRTALRYEEMIRQSFAAAPDPGEASPLAIRATFGGLRDFAFHRLRDDEPEHLAQHIPELIDWAIGYRLAAARGGPGAHLAQLAATTLATEPMPDHPEAGGPTIPWEAPVNDARGRRELTQRERIMRATAQVTAADGYDRLTVPSICAAAGTSHQTFYQCFASKEKAFLAAFDALALEAYSVTAAAFALRSDWLTAGAIGFRALLQFVRDNALFRQINFFELHTAGPIARDRAEAMLSLFTAFMQPDPLPPEARRRPPKVVIEAISGGIWAVIQREITMGRNDSLPELLPELLDIVLIPFGVTGIPSR